MKISCPPKHPKTTTHAIKTFEGALAKFGSADTGLTSDRAAFDKINAQIDSLELGLDPLDGKIVGDLATLQNQRALLSNRIEQRTADLEPELQELRGHLRALANITGQICEPALQTFLNQITDDIEKYYGDRNQAKSAASQTTAYQAFAHQFARCFTGFPHNGDPVWAAQQALAKLKIILSGKFEITISQ